MSPTSFHLSPTSFHCLPGWVLVVGFPAGLSPTSFHLSPRLGACGRVPGWLVSHFLSFVSQARCLWSGLSPTSFHLSPTPFQAGCLVWFPAGLSPTSFHLSPRLGACGRACLPLPFICLPLLFRLGVWSGSRLACLPLLFICLPLLFICLPGWVLVVGFPAGLSPTSLHLSPLFPQAVYC